MKSLPTNNRPFAFPLDEGSTALTSVSKIAHKCYLVNSVGVTPVRSESNLGDPIREAAMVALRRVVDSLLDLMFDAGVTVQDFNYLVRETAVHSATRRVLRESGRESKSRVAIITGLPRSEIARILRSADPGSRGKAGQHPARRVLAAWYDDSRFLTETGEPAELPIFGRKRSFERLVAMHGGGIPVRAMLDELTNIDAVEQLSNQKVKAKTRFPILTGLTSAAVTLVGERGSDLLDTLTNNVRRRSQPLFEGTAVIDDADPKMVSLLRRELADQGTSFINGANSLLNRSRNSARRVKACVSRPCRLGVTVYYFQDEQAGTEKAESSVIRNRRKNLRRQQFVADGQRSKERRKEKRKCVP